MTEEAKAAKREYDRQWRQRNKDHIKAYNERYWQRKANEAAAKEAAKKRAAARLRRRLKNESEDKRRQGITSTYAACSTASSYTTFALIDIIAHLFQNVKRENLKRYT